MSIKYNSKILNDKEKIEEKQKLKEIVESVDKKQIAELFEQGLKCDSFKPAMWCDQLNFNFSIGEYNYTLTRRPNDTNAKATEFINYRNQEYQKFKLQQQLRQKRSS